MFELLAYAFTTLFAGIVVFGHVLLFRDIFFSAPSGNPGPNKAVKRSERVSQRQAA